MGELLEICVIVPTFNEKDNITDLVQQLLALPIDAHVIIVDDNSPDGTGQIADELAKQYERVQVIHRRGKLGLGTAYIAGFKKGLADGAERLITMDADFSHNPAYIPRLVELADFYHITIGSRYIPQGGVVNWGLQRRFLSWGANLFARTVLGLKANDCTAGFRCYHREVLLNIELNQIFSNGYSFLVEMIFKCQRLGFTVGEIPIIFANRERGQSKISHREIYKAMYTVMRLAVERLKPKPHVKISQLPHRSQSV
ncbi:MAG TPA: polyprenol monophosphomannose synthase [Anaerolineae bacterium]|nr:polyprenol monophosphomannose synthase [Anaerolineae bacterium]MCB0224504.1 polyprenol monophosphomannose synthase [Anaerolineae bacterium]MCB9108358.1 polyprenol monophosphomannose synthase [Anaerolineales bacterium]HRV91213.1 polyprenol monophosphomannose synthase [Anaerolineae bacterium]